MAASTQVFSPMRSRIDTTADCRAFTRADLCGLLATASLLIGVLCGSGSATRTAAEAAGCQNNLRQLSQAWLDHAADHPLLIGNPNSGLASAVRDDVWAMGWLGWDTSSVNTNTSNIQTAGFAPYIGSATGVFRCPSDRFVAPVQRHLGWRYRVRSYSMNGYIGPVGHPPFDQRYREFKRQSDFLLPSETFVFTEEHPDSINDPWFGVMPDGSGVGDVPASFHGRGAGFSFADGHVELHRWRGSLLVKPVRFAFNFGYATNDADLLWLGQRSSQRR